MKKLDVYISGETMDLCIPTLEFAKESKWYSWFNNPQLTRYLEQGLFPITPEAQEDFFYSQGKDRLIFIISNKSDYMGVVSLSHINLIKKTCEIATVIDSSVDKLQSPYIALEAIARITKHAFEVLGINRIFAGQHKQLVGWRQRMELLGYVVEGIHADKFNKGRETADAISLACVHSTYKRIVKHRGALWDSREKFKIRYKTLPKEDFTIKLEKFFDSERTKYYDKLFAL